MKRKPNILHFFTDMQRFDTIAALGNPVIKTPNLDKLVREGVSFTNAFSPAPVCVAARCSMIYGLYSQNTGVYENDPFKKTNRMTFMDVLSRSGYNTHGIGKCHFEGNKFGLYGFKKLEVQEEGGETPDNLSRHDYMKYLWDKGYRHIVEANGIRSEMYYTPQPSQIPARDHPTQWVGDRSVDFLRKTGDSPWYLFSSFIHPHPPLTPPNPWHKLYRSAQMPLPNIPDNYEELLTLVNRMQNRYKYADHGMSDHQLRLIKAGYYACISFVDYQIGRIINALKETGQLENTLILFTSDHGEYLGDYGSLGKRSMHDASCRIPMIIRMPGRFEGGIKCQDPASLIDIAPTFLRAAGLSGDIPTHKCDGVDLYKLFHGKDSRTYVFAQMAYHEAMAPATIHPSDKRYLTKGTEEDVRARFASYMAVSKNLKYIYSAPDNKEILFDRKQDPLERKNTAESGLAQYDGKEIKKALIQHLTVTGETAGLEDDNWKIQPRIRLNDDPNAGLLIQDGYTPWADMTLPEGYY